MSQLVYLVSNGDIVTQCLGIHLPGGLKLFFLWNSDANVHNKRCSSVARGAFDSHHVTKSPCDYIEKQLAAAHQKQKEASHSMPARDSINVNPGGSTSRPMSTQVMSVITDLGSVSFLTHRKMSALVIDFRVREARSPFCVLVSCQVHFSGLS